MTVEVRYVSRAGSTKKVADAIAAQLQTVAKEVHTPLAAGTDILFLGSGIYAGGADKALQTFISNLTPSMVKKVVVFTTGASQDVYPKIKAQLTAQGIAVADEHFFCPSKFLFVHKGRPNEEDLANAKAFAKTIAEAF